VGRRDVEHDAQSLPTEPPLRTSESTKQPTLDLETYAAIARGLAVADRFGTDRILASHDLTPTRWAREAERWALVLDSDPVLHDRFQELYTQRGAAEARTAEPGRLMASPRASWLFLVAGAALLPFAIFQTVIPIAAWLAPVFLLRFVRSRRPAMAIPVVAAAGYVAFLVGTRGVIEGPAAFIYALPGTVAVIPYAADRWAHRNLGGFARTLVYPTIDTALSFLASFGAFATMGMTAYSQVDDLPLIQIVSVTGIWGLQFVIGWTAPVINDAWEAGLWSRRAWVSSRGWLAVVGLTLVVGGARVALFPPGSETVRVAGLAPSRSQVERIETAGIVAGERTVGEQDRIAAEFLGPQIEDLFARTELEAAAGANIVVWAEAAISVFDSDEPALIEQARQVAIANRIYLQIGMVVLLPRSEYPTVENRAVMFGPDGEIVWDYAKATVPLGDGNAPGPGMVPFTDTPYGRLATVICFDADLPGLVRQAGQAGVDILLVPASDFGTAGEPHARMSVLRAVENGTALFRPARRGVSIAVDHLGRTLGYQDDYETDAEQTMVSALPTRGSATAYSLIGDILGWAVLIGAPVLLSMAWRNRKTPDGGGRKV
jgi:apolipoprotein N-acyltransferase